MSEQRTWPRSVAGDCLQLAATFAQTSEEELLSALYAVREQIFDTAVTSNDQQVCNTKLNWWRSELARCASGEARHPASIKLAELLPISAQVLDYLLEWTVAAESMINAEAIDSPEQFRLQSFRRHGVALCIVVIQKFGRDVGDAQIARARDLGIALALIEDLSAGHADPLWLPQEQDADSSENTFDALSQYGLSLTPKPADCTQITLIAVLSRIIAARYETLLHSGNAPGPLRLLFSAWRQARRTRRAQKTHKDLSPS